MKQKPNDIRLATLLSIIGDEGTERFENYRFDDEEADDIDAVLQKFDSDFKTLTNILNERYQFLKRR